MNAIFSALLRFRTHSTTTTSQAEFNYLAKRNSVLINKPIKSIIVTICRDTGEEIKSVKFWLNRDTHGHGWMEGQLAEVLKYMLQNCKISFVDQHSPSSIR